MKTLSNITANAKVLYKAQGRERIDAARAHSLAKRAELGMGKTAKIEMGLKPNERNTAKLAKATERAAKAGLTKKR